MNGYLIDPTNKTVTLVDHEGTIESIYKHIGVDCFDAVRLPDNHVAYVDDEGLLKPGTHVFKLHVYDGFLAGKALVVGATPDGDDAPATVPINVLLDNVEWTDLETTGELTPTTTPSPGHIVIGDAILRPRRSS